MTESFDLAVIGAGPGGLAAAATAAEYGLRVCLVDDNPTLGGQIWREPVDIIKRNDPVARWRMSVDSRVTVLSSCRAVAALSISPTILRLEGQGTPLDIRCTATILATGARELFLPFPGWTLPGVYGAGGLQAFVKSGLQIAEKRVVVAGTGPLLLAVASGLSKAGARVLAIIEQAPFVRLARFSLGLLSSNPGKLLEGVGLGWTNRGIPYRTDSWVSAALGEDRLRAVRFTNGARVEEMKADMLAIGFHLVANTELAQTLGCAVENGFVSVDSMQRTSVSNVYCIGEATGVGGVQKAQLEGKIAALAVSGKLALAEALVPARNRQVSFARQLTAAFELRQELRSLPQDDTIVCRCEDVSHGSLRSRQSWREAKLHTRCGMGPCQGRICGPATQVFYGWSSPHPRPPLFPADVATLGHPLEITEAADAVPAAPEH